MTTYVLIAILYYNRTMAMQEFNSKDKCEIAAKVIQENGNNGFGNNVKTFCVEK